MHRSLAQAAILVVLLAGCTGAANEVPQASPTIEAAPVQADGAGSIRGVVVDTAQLPVPNATVALEQSDKAALEVTNTTSSAIGAFKFDDVRPGIYRLRASAPGFGEGASLITVVSDETADMRIILQDVASDLPYLEIQQRTGIFRCAFALVLQPTRCDEALEAAGLGAASGYHANFTISKGHQAIVLETNWGTKDATMDVWTSYINDQGDWKYFQEVRGTPILRLDLVPGQDVTGTYVSVQDPDFYGPVPESSQSFTMNTETTYIGQFQQEADGYLNPVCTHTWGNCTGVGAVFDFRFDQFVSTFYNEAPADVAAYSAIPKEN